MLIADPLFRELGGLSFSLGPKFFRKRFHTLVKQLTVIREDFFSYDFEHVGSDFESESSFIPEVESVTIRVKD
jgi:hypothetical protein